MGAVLNIIKDGVEKPVAGKEELLCHRAGGITAVEHFAHHLLSRYTVITMYYVSDRLNRRFRRKIEYRSGKDNQIADGKNGQLKMQRALLQHLGRLEAKSQRYGGMWERGWFPPKRVEQDSINVDCYF